MTTSWIEKCMIPGTSRLVADGETVCNFTTIDIPDEILGEICSIIDKAIIYGEGKKAREIMKALNV